MNVDWLDKIKLPRRIKFLIQRICRGWDDSDLWSLDHSITKYVLPRLKRFKKVNIGHPGNLTPEQWDAILDEMIWFFELNLAPWDLFLNEEDQKRYDKAGKYFMEYFNSLWD